MLITDWQNKAKQYKKLSEEVENMSIDFDCTEPGFEKEYGRIAYSETNDLLHITRRQQELSLTPQEGNSLLNALKKLYEE